MKWLKKTGVFIFMLPIWFYKYAISPWTPSACRHYPSCSQYALDALKTHGVFTGGWMATNRILRCHPWGTHGYDPVAKFRFKRYKPMHKYQYSSIYGKLEPVK